MIVRTDSSLVYFAFIYFFVLFFVLIEQINNMENGFIDVIIQAREQTIYKHCVAMKNYNNGNANEDYSIVGITRRNREKPVPKVENY